MAAPELRFGKRVELVFRLATDRQRILGQATDPWTELFGRPALHCKIEEAVTVTVRESMMESTCYTGDSAGGPTKTCI